MLYSSFSLVMFYTYTYEGMYICQCYFLNSSSPFLPPQCPQVRFVYLHCSFDLGFQGDLISNLVGIFLARSDGFLFP